MKKLTSELLAKLGQESKNSPRLRKNFNFHNTEEVVQRFLNVMQPGTYVVPHAHLGQDDFEFYCVLQGRIGFLIFSENGEISETFEVSASGSLRGVEIPGGTFHSVVCLEANTVVLEIKEGPYNPTGMKHILPGYPDELTALQGGPDSSEAKKIKDLISSWRLHFA